jgi:hypothetical protein
VVEGMDTQLLVGDQHSSIKDWFKQGHCICECATFVYILKNTLHISGLRIIIFLCSERFLRTYVCFVTGFTCQLVSATFVVVLRDEKVFRSGVLYWCF